MHSWTEKLLALQDAQIMIAMMQQQVERMPAEKQKAEDEYAVETAALKAAQDDLHAHEVKIRLLDSQIDSARTKKKDFQSKTSSIKSNDEYRAAILQIELCDKAIGALEDEQLAEMEAVEEQKKAVAVRKAALEAAKQRAALVIADVEKRGRELQARIDAKTSALDGLQAGIDPVYLAAYRRLRGGKLIKATQKVLVPVDGGSCGACRMHVTPQQVADTKSGKLTFCPSCQSMLYWDD